MHFFFVVLIVFLSHFSLLNAKVHSFPFSNAPIDVVIPCVEKDRLTLNLSIRGIRENGINIRRIIVVSKKPITNEAEWFNEADYPFSFQDIAAALAKYSNPLTKQLLEGSRVGWYFQQLLKLYAPLVIPNISPNVLILDSDTIFMKPVTFLNENNAGMYNPGAEYHSPYFDHASRLLRKFRKCFPEYSGISHHMIFQRPVIDILFKEVEYFHKEPFWQAFCKLVDTEQLPHSGASEYEIYFNYVFSKTDQVSLRKLKWRDIERISEIQKCREEGLDYVCLHTYNRIDE